MRASDLKFKGACTVSCSAVLAAGLLLNPGTKAVAAASASGTFTLTGSLNTARYQHKAVLLTTGEVLVMGGIGVNGNYDSFASAELYNPSREKWIFTGNMVTGRTGHTATLLKTGEVLVAGGSAYEIHCYNTAELYDPSTGTWTATGNMTQARCLHSATLLPNGNVLVAGGVGSLYDSNTVSDTNTVTSAEIYNPNTHTFTATGSLNIARADAATTLLADGQVLTVGGYNKTGQSTTPTYLTSVELYNPTSGQWSVTTSIPASSFESTTPATLPDGDVLISNAAQFYNPSTATWTATGALPTIAGPPQVASPLDTGNVLGTGTHCKSTKYYNCGFGPTANAYLYDSSANTWSVTGSMHYARFSHTMTVMPNGQVLVAGGFSHPFPGYVTPLSTAELYTP
jgi:N-acetylneuraminic acid mutarotase